MVPPRAHTDEKNEADGGRRKRENKRQWTAGWRVSGAIAGHSWLVSGR